MKKMVASSKNKQNFIREIENLELIQHENVVRIYDYEIKDNQFSIVMEYCENNLYNYLKDAIYPLIKQNVKTIAYMILSGLKELHAHGIVHRVIQAKPGHQAFEHTGQSSWSCQNWRFWFSYQRQR